MVSEDDERESIYVGRVLPMIFDGPVLQGGV